MDIGPWTLSGFDLFVIGLVGLSGLLAMARGFSREVISIIALLLSLAGALFIYGRYRDQAVEFVRPAWLADTVLFVGVSAIIYLLISFLLRGWANTIKGRTPSMLNRLLGLFYGMGRGALIASLFVLLVSNMAKDGEPAEWMSAGTTYPTLRIIADKVEMLPFARVREIADDIREKGETSDLPDIPTGEKADEQNFPEPEPPE